MYVYIDIYTCTDNFNVLTVILRNLKHTVWGDHYWPCCGQGCSALTGPPGTPPPPSDCGGTTLRNIWNKVITLTCGHGPTFTQDCCWNLKSHTGLPGSELKYKPRKSQRPAKVWVKISQDWTTLLSCRTVLFVCYTLHKQSILINFPKIWQIFIMTKKNGSKWKNGKLSNLPIWTIGLNLLYVLFWRFPIGQRHITSHSSYISPYSCLTTINAPPTQSNYFVNKSG